MVALSRLGFFSTRRVISPLTHITQPAQRHGLNQVAQLRQRYGCHQFNTDSAGYPRQVHWTKNFNNVASALDAASPQPVTVTVIARIQTVRNHKKHAFVKLGDGSTTRELQVLLSPEKSTGLTTGSMITVTGVLQPCPPGKEQSHELLADEITIVDQVDPETYPLQKKHHTPQFLRAIPHIRLRTSRHMLLTRLRSEVDWFLSEWFRNHEFIRIHPPVITSTDCEGGGEVFTVTPASQKDTTEHFFHTPKFLTPSSQLHLEAYIHVHKAVWSLGPTFRAEKSDTPRHLSEFYMLEVEILTTSLYEVMHLVETLLRDITTKLSTSRLSQELLSRGRFSELESDPDCRIQGDALRARWQGLLTPEEYPRISYTEAMKMLENFHTKNPLAFANRPVWEHGLSLEHERHITETVGKGKNPVFVTDYPTILKPFYMPPSSSTTRRETCASFDLLFPGVAEVVGGSLRYHNANQVRTAMEKKGLTGDGMGWYLDLYDSGGVPHGGFGLGFDRLLCYLSGETNLREVVGFPRWHGRCEG